MLNKQSSPISSINFLDQLSCQRDMGDNSAEILFLTFLQEALVSSSGMGRDVHSLMLSIQHSSADHGVVHPPRCLEGWFWRGCCDIPEPCKFPSLDSCQSGSTPSRWSCAPSTKCREVFSCAWFRKSGSFFQSQQAGSLFHSCR